MNIMNNASSNYVVMRNIFYITLLYCCVVISYQEVSTNNEDEIVHDVRSLPKFCLYRKWTFPATFFNEVSGQGCYSFGHENRFKNNRPYNYTTIRKYHSQLNLTFSIIGGIYESNGRHLKFTFDYQNETVKNIVAASFKLDKYYQKWLQCCERADECCRNTMTNENIRPTKDTCSSVWDGWDCFSPIKTNTEANNYCPSYSYMGEPLCVKTSVKQCFANATWNETTDYSTCEYSNIAITRTIFHAYALLVSIFLCLPAIIIFFIYPSLRITRVILHRNLLLAIVIKNCFVIMSKLLINLDALENNNNVLNGNGVPCRVLAFFERVAVNAMYACMLVDGFYLHKIIVTVFRKDSPIYWFYVAVAVLSLVPILIWASLKASLDNVYCWVVDESWLSWIIDGSRYAMLAVNLILLMDIIRVLMWKLRRNDGSQHTKATLRATLILLPLFGIQFIMMSQRPVNATCLWDNVFYYISYIIDSSQGILVSFFYCYFNKEVQALLRRSYQKCLDQISSRFNIRRPTINLRRSTTTTLVSEQTNAPLTFKPKKNLNRIPEEFANQNTKIQSWVRNVK